LPQRPVSTSSPSTDAFAITKSDSIPLEKPIKALRVGSAGNVTYKDLDGESHLFPNAIAGEIIYAAMTYVMSTGTAGGDFYGYV
jgi:hypothetical protein